MGPGPNRGQTRCDRQRLTRTCRRGSLFVDSAAYLEAGAPDSRLRPALCCGMKGDTLDLFGAARPLPEGFAYRPGLLTTADERDLVERLRVLPLSAFDFHGYQA